uniref:Uncharacterized protein n=2 Tax=unclassified Rosemountvirus TaxID=2738372 RepID=A0AAU8GFW1_9CAUD
MTPTLFRAQLSGLSPSHIGLKNYGTENDCRIT